MNLEHIPEEITREILSYLDAIELTVVSWVDTQLLSIVRKSVWNVWILLYTAEIDVLDILKVTSVDVSISAIDDSHLATIGRLAHVVRLNIDGGDAITDVGLSYLMYVIDLSLDGCEQITDIGLASLNPRMQSLSLSGCRLITCAGLAHFRELRSLNLSYCEQITDAGVNQLSGGPHTLSLQYPIAGKALNYLGHLTTLNLAYCFDITDVGIANLISVQHLNIKACPGITHTGLKLLPNLKTVVDVDGIKKAPKRNT